MGCCFENTLHYSSPAHGDWGVVRVGMLAPESFQLFVCPFACGRHGAIGAIKQGFKDRLAYLYISQSDIISGYDDQIFEAVEQLLCNLYPCPKVFFIFVSCLDDLIGTDHEALVETLSGRFPNIHFRVCHMNPISLDSELPPPVSIQNNLYSLLETLGEQDAGINSIGNLVAISPESELHYFLKLLGVKKLRHISKYQTFLDYQEMACSRGNLVLSPAGLQAAQQMQERLGTPYLFEPVSYSIEAIEKAYSRIARFLRSEEEIYLDFSREKDQAVKAIQSAREKIGNIPIIVDASAVMLPFGLARALLEYGFTVARVEAQKCIPIDRENMEWLSANHPEVDVQQPQHHQAVLFDRRLKDSVAIGIDGAYLAGSRYVVDLFGDEGMFGFYGICKLMARLEQAVEAPADLEQLINGYGLVV
ncbi:nitrogenase component 1 [Oscillospiraceae bacterium PP1C4]